MIHHSEMTGQRVDDRPSGLFESGASFSSEVCFGAELAGGPNGLQTVDCKQDGIKIFYLQWDKWLSSQLSTLQHSLSTAWPTCIAPV